MPKPILGLIEPADSISNIVLQAEAYCHRRKPTLAAVEGIQVFKGSEADGGYPY